MTWNALDYPAVAFPVTYVDKAKDLKVDRTQFLGVEDKANYETCKLIADTCSLLKIYTIDDPTMTHGAPVGLQLVARTQEEEALLKMMEIVEKELLSEAPLL
jgi:amidase